jgi:hypothetical protein
LLPRGDLPVGTTRLISPANNDGNGKEVCHDSYYARAAAWLSYTTKSRARGHLLEFKTAKGGSNITDVNVLTDQRRKAHMK